MGTLEAGSLEVGTSYGVGLESLSGFLWSVLAGGGGIKKKRRDTVGKAQVPTLLGLHRGWVSVIVRCCLATSAWIVSLSPGLCLP